MENVELDVCIPGIYNTTIVVAAESIDGLTCSDEDMISFEVNQMQTAAPTPPPTPTPTPPPVPDPTPEPTPSPARVSSDRPSFAPYYGAEVTPRPTSRVPTPMPVVARGDAIGNLLQPAEENGVVAADFDNSPPTLEPFSVSVQM